MSLESKTILITGGAARVGRELALGLATAGADIIVHYGRSKEAADRTADEIVALGREATLIQADLNNDHAIQKLLDEMQEYDPIFGLINNASIFKDLDLAKTSAADWEEHLQVNLTAPFLLSKGFAEMRGDQEGRIINLLDWRALRPGADHFPYTISKAGMAALTRSMAIALAPTITVNGIAFGAILPPSDGGDTSKVLDQVPAKRWAEIDEVVETARFLLEGPAYITGEIIHLDGGRHLL